MTRVALVVCLLLGAAAGSAAASRQGAWVDEIILSQEEDRSRAVDRLAAGEIHLFGVGISDPGLYRRIRDLDRLDYGVSYGNTVELTFNPVGPTFGDEDRLNPFHVPAIREAMNWLIDRTYIAQEIYGGLASPRYLPFKTVFPDYARLADVVGLLEVKYAHSPRRAREVITAEMQELGARLVDGTWHYDGRPVELTFLIRLDDERREVGDHVANQLEEIGFRVVRDYRTAAEASPIWIGSDPADGRWHIYTGGWISTVISRDEATMFNSFFTPRGRPDLLWQSYTPSPEFDEVADRLARRDYETLEERRQMMEDALRMAMEDSVRIWLVDQQAIWPRRADLEVASDLAGGISGSWLWPLTLRFTGQAGGRVQIAVPSLLTEPWNPVAGTNWIFDTMAMRATADFATLPDPFSGLAWPQRVEKVEVYVREGLPVAKTHDWVELEFVPSIEVPADAWIDWDHAEQRFVTVQEKHTDGLSARTRAVVHYEEDLFENRWHDGSSLSLADALAGLVLTFERADEESPLYDEADAAAFESFIRHFRGMRILQQDPLVVEVYSDHIHPDAELIAQGRAGYFFPSYGTSSAPWHLVALGMRAEEAGELAFSKSKADRLESEHMSFISGPSLSILDGHLEAARREGYIPFENTLGRYVDRAEARRRFERLARWRRERGHFWVGPGPFYVHSVHPTQGVLVFRRFEQFRDSADKWLRFVEAPIPEVTVSAPSRRVRRGERAEFEVSITSDGEPYRLQDVEFVNFLVFDGRDRLALQGEAEPMRDGRWRVVLSEEQTAAMEVGSNRLQVAVSSLLVAIPGFDTFTFVTMP